ncbi:hypothetical protein [Onishia taeanensis]
MAKLFKGLNSLISKSSNKFDTSVHRFPDIKMEKIANSLQLFERGKEDGELDFPTPDSTSMSASERNAIEEVRKLRSSALNNFESELESYNARIASVKDEGEHISLIVGKSVNEIDSISKVWKNRLENPRNRVHAYQEKLREFQKNNGIEGPPREKGNFILTIALIFMLALIETIMNGYFFAEENPMGYFGGMLLATIISFLNVSSSAIFGHFSRAINKKRRAAKIWGWILVATFIVLALTLNFSIAHLRDALEIERWDIALIEAIVTFKATPFELRSISSWLVFGFGAIVSFTSFWKAFSFSDPYPGYSRLWEETENAIEEYAYEYDEAHDELNAHFEEASKDLRNEVSRRRDNMKSAEDALAARASLLRSFNVFLDNCNEGVNKLLRVYRDANIKSRTKPAPDYFNSTYEFEDYDLPELRSLDIKLPKSSEEEIERVEKSVKRGVEELLRARKKALSAFPTVSQIKHENQENSISMQNESSNIGEGMKMQRVPRSHS